MYILITPENSATEIINAYQCLRGFTFDSVMLKKTQVVYDSTGYYRTPIHSNLLLTDGLSIVDSSDKYPEALLSENWGYVLCVDDGLLYRDDDRRIAYACDAKKYHLVSALTKTNNGNYYKDKSLLVELPGLDLPVLKTDLIQPKDVDSLWPRQLCNPYNREYYKYRFNIPDSDYSHPWFFNETTPITDHTRRIGIEYEIVDGINLSKQVYKSPELRSFWSTARDGSLPDSGVEFVSVPFKLSELETGLSLMKQFRKSNMATCAGYHVHIGAQDYTFKDIVKLIKLCFNIESQFFNLVDETRQSNDFCMRLHTGRFKGFLTSDGSEYDEIQAGNLLYANTRTSLEERHTTTKYSARNSRKYWVNIDRLFRFRFKPESKTIEFRLHEATLDIEKFRSFVKLCWQVVDFAKSNDFKSVVKTKDITEIVSKDLLKYVGTKTPVSKSKINKKPAFREQSPVRNLDFYPEPERVRINEAYQSFLNSLNERTS